MKTKTKAFYMLKIAVDIDGLPEDLPRGDVDDIWWSMEDYLSGVDMEQVMGTELAQRQMWKDDDVSVTVLDVMPVRKSARIPVAK